MILFAFPLAVDATVAVDVADLPEAVLLTLGERDSERIAGPPSWTTSSLSPESSCALFSVSADESTSEVVD